MVLVVFSVFSYINRNQEDPGVEPSSPKEVQGIEKFATAQEFKEYIAKAGDSWNYYSGGITARTTMPMVEESLQMDFAGKGVVR